MKENAIVFDTSAFMAGFDPLTIPEKQFTVPEVKNEILQESLLLFRFNTARDCGKLKVVSCNDSFLQKIIEIAKKLGDLRYLSKADLCVLALALELKKDYFPLILTDDYSIQNVANKARINFASLMTFGIKHRFNWILYCPACYHKYPSDYKLKSCKICGTEIKRKPKKKSQL